MDTAEQVVREADDFPKTRMSEAFQDQTSEFTAYSVFPQFCTFDKNVQRYRQSNGRFVKKGTMGVITPKSDFYYKFDLGDFSNRSQP